MSIGGLIGGIANRAKFIASSYALTGEFSYPQPDPYNRGAIGGLVGRMSTPRQLINQSYWDSNISGIETSKGLGDSPQTSAALMAPTNYTDIYVDWDHGFDIDNNDGDDNITTGIDALSIWCDKNLDGEIRATEKNQENKIWDFGSPQDYPAIRCTPDSLADQRRWWFLNRTTGKPQLNSTRLLEVLTEVGVY